MKTMFASFLDRCLAPARDRKNQRRVILWSLVWILGWMIVMVAAKREWLTDWQVAAGTALTLVPAILTIGAYRRYLRQADELHRKIELEALALSFGVGVIGGITYYPLALGGVVEMSDYLFVVLAMVATHAVGVLLGHRRYS